MFNNTTDTHRRQREENINGSVIENHNEPYNNQKLFMRQLISDYIDYKTDALNQEFNPSNAIRQNMESDNRVKKYSLSVGKYINKLYGLKDPLEFITNVELTYELNGNIVISYTDRVDFRFARDQIEFLKLSLELGIIK